MKTLIVGGTGTLGKALLRDAHNRAWAVRLAGRRLPAADGTQYCEWVPLELSSGRGLPAAIEGVQTVIHAATDPRRSRKVDVNGTARLLEACRSCGVQHMVYISIVGCDAIPLGYYRCKRKAEQLVEESGVPYTILRATQFHDFVERLIARAARFPFVIPLPTDFLIQSVATGDVAARLLQCAEDGPSGRVPDFGGPELMTLGDAAREWIRVTGRHKPLLHLPVPGRIAAAFRSGKNVVRSGEFGAVSWQEWLQQSAIPKLPER
ncbi:MAG: nucleotide-diphosphate-sugar epimerase [Pirellulaceae bacterium]|nr:MAG: nucleotide-diphosphate-sugar epimerase [Pirellulaceae bacterium]